MQLEAAKTGNREGSMTIVTELDVVRQLEEAEDLEQNTSAAECGLKNNKSMRLHLKNPDWKTNSTLQDGSDPQTTEAVLPEQNKEGKTEFHQVISDYQTRSKTKTVCNAAKIKKRKAEPIVSDYGTRSKG